MARLTYRSSVDDWMAFQKHALKTSAQYREAVSVHQWFWAIVLGAIAAYIFSDVSRVVGLGAGLLTVALLYGRWSRKATLAAALREICRKKYQPIFADERVLEISDEGLRMENAAGSGLLRWPFVESVDETTTHVFINAPMASGVVVPKSAVAPDVLGSFLAGIRNKLAPIA